MRPFSDITIYFDRNWIGEYLDAKDFQFKLNYLMDFYHRNLDGYKPPKTSRVSLEFIDSVNHENQFYFGSINSIRAFFDIENYLELNKDNQLKYLLDFIHSIILENARKFGWNTDKFIDSYNSINDSNFKFTKVHEPKTSKDRKVRGQAIISKSVDTSTLSINLATDNLSIGVELLSKPNTYWYDSIYKIAESCKWIDNDKFGYKSKNPAVHVYYSLSEKKVYSEFSLLEKSL